MSDLELRSEGEETTHLATPNWLRLWLILWWIMGWFWLDVEKMVDYGGRWWIMVEATNHRLNVVHEFPSLLEKVCKGVVSIWSDRRNMQSDKLCLWVATSLTDVHGILVSYGLLWSCGQHLTTHRSWPKKVLQLSHGLGIIHKHKHICFR